MCIISSTQTTARHVIMRPTQQGVEEKSWSQGYATGTGAYAQWRDIHKTAGRPHVRNVTQTNIKQLHYRDSDLTRPTGAPPVHRSTNADGW